MRPCSEADLPVVRFVQPGQQPQQGRLAGTVASNEAYPLLGFEAEGDPGENLEVGVGFREIVDGQDRNRSAPLKIETGRSAPPTRAVLSNS